MLPKYNNYKASYIELEKMQETIHKIVKIKTNIIII